MPQPGWSKKRERQYEHIKDSLLERGESEDEAEEIAARTVNKARAEAGEVRESRNEERLVARQGPRGRTYDQLYEEARHLDIEGRSKMNKDDLQRAVDKARQKD